MPHPALLPFLTTAPTEDPPTSFARGEQALWAAVITQALMDAASASGKPEARRKKLSALDWLSLIDEDFTTVCDMAGLDPDYVHTKARHAVHHGCQWRLSPGQGWRTRAHAAAPTLLPATPHRSMETV